MSGSQKDRKLLFKAATWKIVNFVSVSATTQHFEAAINPNNIHLDNQSRFCYQDLIFYDGIENSGRLEHSSLVWSQLDFLRGRFRLDI